jgi:cell division protein FtsL
MNALEELQSHISQVDQQLVDLQREVEHLSQEVRA